MGSALVTGFGHQGQSGWSGSPRDVTNSLEGSRPLPVGSLSLAVQHTPRPAHIRGMATTVNTASTSAKATTVLTVTCSVLMLLDARRTSSAVKVSCRAAVI